MFFHTFIRTIIWQQIITKKEIEKKKTNEEFYVQNNNHLINHIMEHVLFLKLCTTNNWIFNFSTYNHHSKTSYNKTNEKSEVKNNKWKNSWELQLHNKDEFTLFPIFFPFGSGRPLLFHLKTKTITEEESFSESELLNFQELSARIQMLDFQEVLLLVWFLQNPSLPSNLKYHRLRKECWNHHPTRRNHCLHHWIPLSWVSAYSISLLVRRFGCYSYRPSIRCKYGKAAGHWGPGKDRLLFHRMRFCISGG